jgi:hypothetical protein
MKQRHETVIVFDDRLFVIRHESFGVVGQRLRFILRDVFFDAVGVVQIQPNLFAFAPEFRAVFHLARFLVIAHRAVRRALWIQDRLAVFGLPEQHVGVAGHERFAVHVLRAQRHQIARPDLPRVVIHVRLRIAGAEIHHLQAIDQRVHHHRAKIIFEPLKGAPESLLELFAGEIERVTAAVIILILFVIMQPAFQIVECVFDVIHNLWSAGILPAKAARGLISFLTIAF